jgi:hypothetical protein
VVQLKLLPEEEAAFRKSVEAVKELGAILDKQG